MKDLYCKYCQKKVAEIETGSKIRKGTVFICRECNKPKIPDYDFPESLKALFGFSPV